MGRFRKILRRGAPAIGVLLIGLLAAGQSGVFEGRRPNDLGVRQGKLKAASPTPNSVNSQSADGYARIAPLNYLGDGKIAMVKLHGIVAAMPAARIVESRPDYLYAEFKSKWLGFVDDGEFYLDEQAGVIHVRSASRLGRGDFGVNRRRVEAIRAACCSG